MAKEQTSAECTHDCSTCSAACGERQQPESLIEKTNELSEVKKVIGIVSGKGGVGKSLVTSLLASRTAKSGRSAAILDADLTGPSIPKAFGITGKAEANGVGIEPLVSAGGVKVMSINLLLENETDPVVWRGPIIAGTAKQFWTDVNWGDGDYMYVDMPPGTGDVPLTVFQSIPLSGIVVVTSPQELVGMIVEKAVKMARLMNVPLLGIVENLSYYVCPDCGKKHFIFGESRVESIAAEYGVEAVARLPLDPAVAAAVDAGKVETLPAKELDPVLDRLFAL